MIYDFLFDGHCASDFDLVLASADGASLSESLGIATPEAITVQPILSDRQFFIRNHYTTMLQKTLRLLHFDRISCQVTPLSTAMQEEIIRWLCREDGYHPFCFLDSEEPDSVLMYGSMPVFWSLQVVPAASSLHWKPIVRMAISRCILSEAFPQMHLL